MASAAIAKRWWTDAARLRAMRRDVRGQQEHLVELERGACRRGRSHVADVNRIERASEQPDAPRNDHSSGVSIAGGCVSGPFSGLGLRPLRLRDSRRARPPRGRAATPLRAGRARPAPVTPEMRKSGRPSSAARAASGATASSSMTESILFAATSCGFAASSGSNSSSSRRSTSRSVRRRAAREAGHVDHVDQHARALEVLQEAVAEPTPRARLRSARARRRRRSCGCR